MLSFGRKEHENAILSEVARFYRDELNVDCYLLVEGGRILKAHKVILCACSSYFQELFSNSKLKTIIFKRMKYDIMKYILNYIYHGVVDVPLKEVESFLSSCKLLLISGLNEIELEKLQNLFLDGENTGVDINSGPKDDKASCGISSVVQPMIRHETNDFDKNTTHLDEGVVSSTADSNFAMNQCSSQVVVQPNTCRVVTGRSKSRKIVRHVQLDTCNSAMQSTNCVDNLRELKFKEARIVIERIDHLLGRNLDELANYNAVAESATSSRSAPRKALKDNQKHFKSKRRRKK